jgi:hypothetical protein
MTTDWQLGGPHPIFEAPTAALRAEDAELLRSSFEDLVRDAVDGSWDPRDRMDLGPFVDCARRLGEDPVAFFSEITKTTRPDVRAWLDDLIRGSADAKFHLSWTLEWTAKGPRYRPSTGELPSSDIQRR